MDSRFSFKDLENVTLKATYNMKIGDREIVPGEIITYFDQLQIANLDEIVNTVTAHGGFDDRARVYWASTKGIKVVFVRGVFSKEQFALMTNARLIGPASQDPIMITEQEFLESDESGLVTLKHVPAKNLFVYDKEAGTKIDGYSVEDNEINIGVAYKEVIVSYVYEYDGEGAVEYRIGHGLLNGFLEFEGRTRIKDDVTGQVFTGIFRIPKLRLMSDLSIRLGQQASPVVGTFRAEGVPVGSRGDSCVGEFFILGEDIESDL